MLLSAVSLSFLMALGLGQVQQQTLPPNEGGAWEKISKSLVLIEQGGKPMGYAVLIDPSGLFLTHSSAIGAGMVSAKTRSGQPVSLITLTIDEPTQLVLLQAQIWSDKEATAISVETGKGLKGKQLLAALPSGPIPGTLVANDRNGVMRPSLRYVPLSEIRFETPNDRVGGSPVFTLDGKLVGLLNATLEPMGAPSGLAGSQKSVAAPPAASERNDGVQNSGYAGPAGVTVAYALNGDVLQRVVDGFRSPYRKATHPTIGAFFSDAVGQGAAIQAILPDSPSSKADLRPGDVVLAVDDVPVRDHFDLAVILFKQAVGKTLTLVVKRGEQTLKLAVTVGKQPD